MTLKVVGTGLGRTGTKSMQTALNMLGVGPCHHMVEVFRQPATMQLWIDAAEGRPNWEAIFDGYNSVVDYPGSAHWSALVDYYPDAKVLHTVRDPDQWFESTQATIFAQARDNDPDPVRGKFFGSFMGPMRDNIADRAYMTDFFRRHTEEVIAKVAPERLLVFEVGEGWNRLCQFLGVPVPADPYPSENSRAEFQARVRAQAEAAGAARPT